MTMLDKDFYSPKEVARILGRSKNQIYKWLREGIIKSTRPGGPHSAHLVSREEVEKLKKGEDNAEAL